MANTQWMYLTKRALSKGIEYAECEIRPSSTGPYARISNAGWWQGQHKIGKDAHETEDAARVRFEAMKAAKLKSLQKQIAKARKLEFRVLGRQEAEQQQKGTDELATD